MAQPMRKFEQEAIVNQIMKTIETKFNKDMEALEETKSYKAIEAVNNDIIDIEDKIKILEEERNVLQSSRREYIDALKTKFDVEVYVEYRNKLSFRFNPWSVKKDVEDQLAIALLSSEWKDNLPAIMEEIANQF
tara:strand:- start:298 stop:699 length:402 start_codon:yes stop_codon:yes gene_type:complete